MTSVHLVQTENTQKNELVFPNLYFLFFLFELADVGQVSSAAQWLFIAQSK